MEQKRVLIIDDSFDLIRVLKSAILTLDPGIDVIVVPSAEEAMLAFYKNNLDLMISDIRLPGMSGMDLVRRIRKKDKALKIMMITGLIDSSLETEAQKAGVDYFLRKPIPMPMFLETVGKFLGIEMTEEKEKAADLVPTIPVVIRDLEEKPVTNLSESMQNLFNEVNALAVLMLDQFGKVAAQVGENPFADFDERLRSLILPVLSSAEKLAQFAGEGSQLQSILSFRFTQRDIVLLPVGDYALVVFLPSGRGKLNFPLAAESLLHYQQELYGILKHMGAIKEVATPSVEKEPDEQQKDLLFALEEVDDSDMGDFEALFDENAQLDQDPDTFWEEFGQKIKYEMENPDTISFDQAAKLGLTPDEEEEE